MGVFLLFHFEVNLRTEEIDMTVRERSCSNPHAWVEGAEELQNWMENHDITHPDVKLVDARILSQNIWMEPEKEPWGWDDLPPMAQDLDRSSVPAGEWDLSDPRNPSVVFSMGEGPGEDNNGWAIILQSELVLIDARDVKDDWQFSETCATKAQRILQDGFGDGTVECEAGPETPEKDGESVVITGDTLKENRGWFEDYYTPKFKQSRYCGRIEVTPEPGSFNRSGDSDRTYQCRITHDLSTDTWHASDRCIQQATWVANKSCAGSLDITERGDGDPDDFNEPPVPDLDPLAQSVSVTSHCPNREDGNPGCQSLEDNSDCGFVDSTCLERGDFGNCFRFERTYECRSTEVSIGDPEVERDTSCPGPVRCMGEDCVDKRRETNDAFGEAATKLKAIQYLKNNATCSSPDGLAGGGCELFQGEAMECKEAVGGIQDCCDVPAKTSLQDYLELSYRSAYVASQQRILQHTGFGFQNPTYGLWKQGKNAVNVVEQGFSSAWESFTGMTQEKAGQAAAQDITKQGLIGQAQQWAMKKAAKFVGKTFGKQAMNTLFQTASGTGNFSISQIGSSTIQFSPAMQAAASVVSFISWVYAIYQIVNLLIKLAFPCEQEEFRLAAKRKTKSAHKIGDYCATEVLDMCIEERTAYCTYDSPLARIVNVQAKPQLPHGWGDPEDPDCSGITPEQLGNLDWSRIDLSEWEDMLIDKNRIPSGPGDITESNVTGPNSTAAQMQEGGYRPTTGERAQSRVQADDPTERREDARQELWGNETE